MDVSVIIVNYNTCKVLNDCLASVFQYTSNIEYEVIVVDNASNDESVEMVKNKYPSVKIIESQKNLGFGKANNLGFEYSSGRNIFLLNSDTLLLENSIKILSDVLDSDDSIGAIGTILIGKDLRQIHSCGKFPSVFKKLTGTNFIINKVDFRENTSVDYITGADLMIPRKVWLRLGGFDPNFFLYYEETDFQKRMSYEGYKRLIVPTTRIIHLEGESSKSVNGKNKVQHSSIDYWKEITMFRSMIYYMHKHSSWFGFSFLKICLYLKYEYLKRKDSKKRDYFRQIIECIKLY